ncbi:MAG: hypothetical protein IKS41_01955 [Alphaproteobacteria bacterium]|nr:hypothetical protein [Alphaproteobacteria bacterium]
MMKKIIFALLLSFSPFALAKERQYSLQELSAVNEALYDNTGKLVNGVVALKIIPEYDFFVPYQNGKVADGPMSVTDKTGNLLMDYVIKNQEVVSGFRVRNGNKQPLSTSEKQAATKTAQKVIKIIPQAVKEYKNTPPEPQKKDIKTVLTETKKPVLSESKKPVLPEAKKPVLTESKKLVLPEVKKPVLTESKKPVLPEVKKPVLTETKKPVLSESKKPVLPEAKKPVLTESKKPVLPEVKKPVLSENKKPVLPEVKKPVLTESKKPVLTETKKPVLTESKKPVLTETKKPVSNSQNVKKQVSLPHTYDLSNLTMNKGVLYDRKGNLISGTVALKMVPNVDLFVPYQKGRVSNGSLIVKDKKGKLLSNWQVKKGTVVSGFDMRDGKKYSLKGDDLDNATAVIRNIFRDIPKFIGSSAKVK